MVVNVTKLVPMRNDAQLRESVESCDIINIYGTGVAPGARFLGHDVRERVAAVHRHHIPKMPSAEDALLAQQQVIADLDHAIDATLTVTPAKDRKAS